jgi:hypothetical protein
MADESPPIPWFLVLGVAEEQLARTASSTLDLMFPTERVVTSFRISDRFRCNFPPGLSEI